MIENHIDAYLFQETWLKGTIIQTRREHTMFYHDLDKARSRRGKSGVAIITSPKFLKCYEYTGGMPPVHTPDDDNDWLSGRYLEINLKVRGFLRLKREHLSKTNQKW